MGKEAVEKILARVYERIIGKSWENDETFEAYQDAWNIIKQEFNVLDFDWTRGEKPRLPM